jgi:polysaccharide deacetylase 2 family uncharacterized protein YibQ
MKKLLAIAIVLAVLPNLAVAKKYEAEKNGRQVVAHTSMAPVVVHKILPPYGLHKHVYAGSIEKNSSQRPPSTDNERLMGKRSPRVRE